MTPSLAALDDASALKQKEWSRGEPGEDMPWLYTTIGRHLTPTAPVCEDVRTDSTLDVTPEVSLEDLPAAVGGIEERENTQQIIDEGRGPPSNVVPPAAEIPETNPKVINERSIQVEPSRRIEVTRETSREDAIVATRQFFTMVEEQRNTAELPVVTTTDVLQMNIPPVPMILLRQNILNQELPVLRLIFQMDHPLYPPLQLLVDLEHGYNMYQKDKLKSLPEKMKTPLEVTH